MNLKKNIFPIFSLILLIPAFAFLSTNDGTYTVDTSASQLAWLAKKVTGQHDGTISIKKGQVEIAEGKLTKGSFTIDMTTIEVSDIKEGKNRQKLIGHLNSEDFFSIKSHPEATFKITQAIPKKSKEGNYHITGDLTIKGKTESVDFPAHVSIDKKMVEAKATIIFDRSKFDVRYGSDSFFDNLGDKAIYDDVEMTVKLIAKK